MAIDLVIDSAQTILPLLEQYAERWPSVTLDLARHVNPLVDVDRSAGMLGLVQRSSPRDPRPL